MGNATTTAPRLQVGDRALDPHGREVEILALSWIDESRDIFAVSVEPYTLATVRYDDGKYSDTLRFDQLSPLPAHA